MKRTGILLASASIFTLGTYPVLAQDATGEEEVVVTAQKRVQAVNSVGMSITAASAEKLTTLGITKPADLVRIVPSMTFTQSQLGTPVFTIRGIGFYDAATGAAQTVSIYVDEVPLSFAPTTLGASLDIQRVEVLKGPQGTLFGQNSTGGAINYIAAKPTDTFEAGLDLTVDSYNRIDASGFVSGPITDTLRARVALRAVNGGAWQISNTRPNDRLGDDDQLFGRLLLDWTPTEKLSIQVNLNAWQDRSDTQAVQNTEISPMVPGGEDPELYNVALGPQDIRHADWSPDWPMRRDSRFWQASLRVDYKLNDILTLTSISSYLDYHGTDYVDVDGTPLAIFDGRAGGNAKSFFQEARIAVDTDRLHGLIGINYETSDTTGVQDYRLPNVSLAHPLGPFGDPLTLDRSDFESEQDIVSRAIFANIEYDVTDRLNVQAGIRYTENDRDFAGCVRETGNGNGAIVLGILSDLFSGRPIGTTSIPYGGCITLDNINPGFLPSLYVDELNESNTSWRVGVNYEVVDQTLLYANVSKGYKAGGFSNIGASAHSQLLPATQESVLAYEAGVKSRLWDGLAQVNAAVFYYDYNDKQLRGRVLDAVFGSIERLINVPKSEVFGAEFDVTLRPTDGLTLMVGGTYVDSQVLSDHGNPFLTYTPDGVLADYTNSPFPFTPEWSLVADLEYEWDVGDDLVAFAGANARYNSGTNNTFISDAIPAEETEIKSFAALDLRAGVGASTGQWRVNAFVRNVTNEHYWFSTFDAETVWRLNARPRTFGVTISYRWG